MLRRDISCTASREKKIRKSEFYTFGLQKRFVDSYVKVTDWRVKENSTVTYSVGV